MPAILAKIKCSNAEPAAVRPAGFNKSVMAVLNTFMTEVKHRRSQQMHSLSLTVAQTYVLRELRSFYSSIEDDDDLKRQIATLEEAFRRPISAAVKR